MNFRYFMVAFEIPSWVYSPIWYLLLIPLACEVMLPRAWAAIEARWWKSKLGNSSLARDLRREAVGEFQLLVEELVKDHGIPHTLAVPWAIVLRFKNRKQNTIKFQTRRAERSPECFESMIDELNRLWRDASHPDVLMAYVRGIENMADDPCIDRDLRLQGKSAVAVVKYALGQLRAGNKLGADNFKVANELESDLESKLKWFASYGFFYSTLFLGQHKKAIKLMSDQWGTHYSSLSPEEAVRLRNLLKGKLILNPILALPRHFILAFALNNEVPFLKQYWPSEEVFNSLSPEDQKSPIKWVESWYSVARIICQDEPISMDFSTTYSAFFLTLLLLDQDLPASYLHRRINEAFDTINDSSPIVSRYARFGFNGIYHLVCGENEKAFESLSSAAVFSEISGNRFAEVLFRCAHAVAGSRLNRTNRVLDPQVDYHMKRARTQADEIQSDFYTVLCDAAESAISLQRGHTIRAQRLAQSSRMAGANTRIFRIFDNDVLESRRRYAEPNNRLLIT